MVTLVGTSSLKGIVFICSRGLLLLTVLLKLFTSLRPAYRLSLVCGVYQILNRL